MKFILQFVICYILAAFIFTADANKSPESEREYLAEMIKK